MAKKDADTTMLELSKFIDNEEKGRFELIVDDAAAYVAYIREDDKLILYNTEIPESIAKIDDSAIFLMSKILRSCSKHQIKLEIFCPFAKAVMNRMRIADN
jgi:predicted GNAT family acetyltransferase